MPHPYTPHIFVASGDKLCVSAHHHRIKDILADPQIRSFFQEPNSVAAHLEIRLDRFDDLSAATLRHLLGQLEPSRLVISCRSTREGGARDVPPKIRRKLLLLAARFGVGYIDVELHDLDAPAPEVLRAAAQEQGRRTQVIVSWHAPMMSHVHVSFRELERLQTQACERGADVIKLVVCGTSVRHWQTLAKLWRTPSPHNLPRLAMAQGLTGAWTRIVALRSCNAPPFTFARLPQKKGVADGQGDAWATRATYRLDAIDATTPLFGVVGSPIVHSLSPMWHNRLLAANDVAGLLVPFDPRGKFAYFIKEVAPLLRVKGLAITAPYKVQAVKFCRNYKNKRKTLNAVNTLVYKALSATSSQARSQRPWLGYNTDVVAAACWLKSAIGPCLVHKHIVLLGAGGVALAIGSGLVIKGAKITVWARRFHQASLFCRALKGDAKASHNLLHALATADAVVNCTPLGTFPNTKTCLLTPVQMRHLPKHAIVFDTVYNPMQTLLLKRAQAEGLGVQMGLGMFVYQAKAQARLFYGL